MSGAPAAGVEARRRAAAHVLVEPDQLTDSGPIGLTDEVEHHLRRVVRLPDGAEVSITDGAGNWLLARVQHHRNGLLLTPSTQVDHEPRPDAVRLATAIPKGDRVDWLVQKATELGAGEVMLLHAQHSVVRWNEQRADKQLTRLRRIADEALRQSRRVWRMEVSGPLDATGILSDAVVAEPGGRSLAATDSFVAIGPEGGWTDDELALAPEHVDLGENVLRTETAVVVAAVLAAAARR